MSSASLKSLNVCKQTEAKWHPTFTSAAEAAESSGAFNYRRFRTIKYFQGITLGISIDWGTEQRRCEICEEKTDHGRKTHKETSKLLL